MTEAFGAVTREFHTPSDGIVIGKSVNPAAETGARILHLGVVASDDDPRFLPRVPYTLRTASAQANRILSQLSRRPGPLSDHHDADFVRRGAPT
jgi:hypothetical protein